MGNLLGLQEDNERYRILLRVQLVTTDSVNIKLTGEQFLLGPFCNDIVGGWMNFLKYVKNTSQSWAEMQCTPYTPAIDLSYTLPYPFEPVVTENLSLSSYGYDATTGFWVCFPGPINLFQGNWNVSGLDTTS